jgi:hypothetical protein
MSVAFSFLGWMPAIKWYRLSFGTWEKKMEFILAPKKNTPVKDSLGRRKWAVQEEIYVHHM